MKTTTTINISIDVARTVKSALIRALGQKPNFVRNYQLQSSIMCFGKPQLTEISSGEKKLAASLKTATGLEM
jgi:hypothetical protein